MDNEPIHKDTTAQAETSWFRGQRAMLLSFKKAATKRWKIVLLGALAVLSGVAAWGLVHRLLTFSTFSGDGAWVLLVVTFLTFFVHIVCVGLVGVLVHDRIEELAILVLSSLAYTTWFHVAAYALITLLLLFLGMAYFTKSIRKEEGERVRFSLSRVFERGLGMMLVAILLAVSITSYGVTAKKTESSSVSPVERIGSFLGGTANESLGFLIKGYNPDETVEMFLLRMTFMAGDAKGTGSVLNAPVVVEEAAQLDLSQLYAQLPDEIKEQLSRGGIVPQAALDEEANALVAAQLDAAKQRFLAALNVPEKPGLTIGETVEATVTHSLVVKTGNYSNFLPPLFGVAVFFILSTLTFLYSFCIGQLANAVFWMMRRMKFVHVHRLTASVEVVTLDSPARS